MNKILQPIRFYSDSDYVLAEKQVKNNYKYVPRLLIDRTHLLPFQLIRHKAVEQSQSGQGTQIPITVLRLVNCKNSNNYINLLSSPNSIDLLFYTIGDYVDGGWWDAALYKGGSTIETVPRGKYYLYAEDDSANTWTSCYLISTIPSKTITFEFRNEETNNYVISDASDANGFYWKMVFDSYVFDSGEWDETEESFFGQYGDSYAGFKRNEKLWSCEFLADSNSYDALIYMSKFCDTILLTDEVGQQEQIKIKEISPEAFGHSNHIKIKMNFTITGDMLLSTNTNNIYNYASQSGGDSPVNLSDLLQSHDKKVKTHGKFIKKR